MKSWKKKKGDGYNFYLPSLGKAFPECISTYYLCTIKCPTGT